MTDNIKLYNDNCLNILPTLSDDSVDCVICDLPYAVTGIKWDIPIPFDIMWNELKRIVKPNGNILLFCAGTFTFKLYASNIKDFKYKLIWKKNVPTGMSSASYRPMKYYEEILVFNNGGGNGTYNPVKQPRVGVGKACYKYDHWCGKSNHIDVAKVPKRYDPDFVEPGDVLEFPVVPNRAKLGYKKHPTEKPVQLLERLIHTYSNPGDTVIDFCMGNGSTGVACKNLSRNFIGIEIETDYYNIANNRINNILF